jgi:hypothetical protein
MKEVFREIKAEAISQFFYYVRGHFVSKWLEKKRAEREAEKQNQGEK